MGKPAAAESPVRIRAFRTEDAVALAQIFHAAVQGTAGRYYSAAQADAWSPEPPPPARMLERASDGRAVWVAPDAGDVPLAFIDLEPDGHIDMLFCHPKAAGRGLASALYGLLEAAARQQGIRQLTVEASAAARGFFERKGFALDRRQEISRRGVTLHNYRMVKLLA